MARTDPQLNFRIPAELKERLEAAAVGNKRTLTAELVARLENSFRSELQPLAAVKQSSSLPEDGSFSPQQIQEVFSSLAKNAQEVSALAGLLKGLADGFTISDEDGNEIARVPPSKRLKRSSK
ncbi:Arc family DNA-binding protein [Comamonas sp. JNW]|uniref:Arc family DNA-binding protein n=1 Tax=Comamonas sp. JNW TaxID=2170731 RepID=UPI000DE60D7B|nr:Arc family DNA-binding protein [Comamonas sp. JNW]PWB21312.1 hypothetical protein DCO45_02640 [Comamonas sp. JNW]